MGWDQIIQIMVTLSRPGSCTISIPCSQPQREQIKEKTNWETSSGFFFFFFFGLSLSLYQPLKYQGMLSNNSVSISTVQSASGKLKINAFAPREMSQLQGWGVSSKFWNPRGWISIQPGPPAAQQDRGAAARSENKTTKDLLTKGRGAERGKNIKLTFAR